MSPLPHHLIVLGPERSDIIAESPETPTGPIVHTGAVWLGLTRIEPDWVRPGDVPGAGTRVPVLTLYLPGRPFVAAGIVIWRRTIHMDMGCLPTLLEEYSVFRMAEGWRRILDYATDVAWMTERHVVAQKLEEMGGVTFQNWAAVLAVAKPFKDWSCAPATPSEATPAA